MDDTSQQKVTVTFSQAHGERLTLIADKEGAYPFSTLGQMMSDWGYVAAHTAEPVSPVSLQDTRILIVGAPEADLTSSERAALEQFVQEGGGLLLGVDTSTLVYVLSDLDATLNQMLADWLGLTFHEYHNYPPTYLQRFHPHYITAGVRKIQVGEIASLDIDGAATPLARTKATGQIVMACATVGRGRVVAVGGLEWLADDLLAAFDNAKLVAGMLRWLAGHNSVDIDALTVPKTVKWGETAPVVLQLRNDQTQARPQVACTLESDVDARIDEPARKRRSIPPGKTTQMRWAVHPRVLGNQKVRLSLHVDQEESLYFDELPPLNCLAPGYLTLELKDADGEQRTVFQTEERFIVEGAFHWDGPEQQEYRLALETQEGLLRRGFEEGRSISRWHLQAVAPGQHGLTLKLAETGQSLAAMVKVKPSIEDRLDEIRAAYVCPLDAEIAERLKKIDARWGRERIRDQPFTILSPEEFVKAVYAEKDKPWLQGVLAAIRREKYQNFELLDIFLSHIAPTYLPSVGTFIPYDPTLASDLARLHPTDKRYLAYNLLQTEESQDITVKQNVAAYLLHEKYGHGFFYSETRLGQQLTRLLRHGFFEQTPEIAGEAYAAIARDIKHSAIIVNEGFATWLELTFLAQLDREVRQAVYPRRVLLVEKATGLYDRQHNSDFFQAFPSRHDSPYREGFEYLDFISNKLDPRCAMRVFLVATHIDFGIVEDAQGRLVFEQEPKEIHERLFAAAPDWRSQARLRTMAELIYDRIDDVRNFFQEQHCPTDCRPSGCPLEAFIAEELDWRLS